MAHTTTVAGVTTLSVTDSDKEESQTPQEKAPVRFGWVTGVMVRDSYIGSLNCFNTWYMKQSSD